MSQTISNIRPRILLTINRKSAGSIDELRTICQGSLYTHCYRASPLLQLGFLVFTMQCTHVHFCSWLQRGEREPVWSPVNPPLHCNKRRAVTDCSARGMVAYNVVVMFRAWSVSVRAVYCTSQWRELFKLVVFFQSRDTCQYCFSDISSAHATITCLTTVKRLAL